MTLTVVCLNTAPDVVCLNVESAPCPLPLVVLLLADFDLILVLHPIQSLVNATFEVQGE